MAIKNLKTGQPIQPWDPQTPNADIIASAWKYGSTDFQRRIPEPTKANLQASIKAIVNYQPAYNEFAAALINKVGRTIARAESWQNVLAAYKLGMMEFGESIEEYKFGLIKAAQFDPRRAYGEQALFGRHSVDIQSSYHTINRENRYDLTVEHPVLKRAFLSETGLAQFATDMMSIPTTSDNWDEFLIMSNLFRKYEENDGFFKLHIDELNSKEASDAFLELLREYAEILPYLSERYNAAHMPSHAKKEDLTLFLNPKAKAKLDVQSLAALFNVSYADIPYKVQTLPEEYFFGVGDDIQAVLTTSDFFVCADTYFDINSQPNPAGRYENWFLHHDGIYSVSRFVPAIAFTYGPGTVEEMIQAAPVTSVNALKVTDSTGSDVTGTTLRRGGSYIISTTTDSDDLSAVRFEATGFKSVYSFIENTGELHIAANDSAKTITIASIAVADNEIRNIQDYNITGDLVSYWPAYVLDDDDADGLLEVAPADLIKVDGYVTIPSIRGVQYQKGGVNVNNGTRHQITAANTVFTAVARAGYEIKTGSKVSWTFQP